jgi:hypothetical protein
MLALAFVTALLGEPTLAPPPTLPEPLAIPRESRVSQRRAPEFYRGGYEQARIGGRLGLGVAGFLGPPVPVRAGFVLDALVVGRVPASRRYPAFTVFPELGYSLAAGPRQTRSHLATLGLGLGGTNDGLGVALMPRFVAGSLLGQPVLGVRSGLLVELVRTGGFGLELAYQGLDLAGTWSHALLFTLYVGFYAPDP